MKSLLTTLLTLVLFNVNGQNIKFTLVDQEKESLPFVKVYFLPEGSFTSTDKNGSFQVDKEFLEKQKQLLLSGYGLGDTLLTISELRFDHLIFLKVKEIDLPHFTIAGKKLKSIRLGDKSNPLQEPTNVLRIIDQGVSKDTKYATWVKLPKKKEKIITKIHFYVSSMDDVDKHDISLRFLGSNSRQQFKPERIYSTDGLIDFASRSIITSVKKIGWHTVDLEEQVIISENVNELFLIFDLLKASEIFSLAYQSDNRKDTQMAFYYPEKLSIGRLDKDPQTFAVVLELLVED